MIIRANENVTRYAQEHLSELESAGYLHSSLERFDRIKKYKKLKRKTKLAQIGKVIIKKQEQREQECYAILGVKNAQELNEKYNSDESVNAFINSSFNNIYDVMRDALQEALGTGNLGTKLSKTNKRRIESVIGNSFDKALEDLSDDYQKNLDKILGKGIISKEMVRTIKNIDNRTVDNKMKKASQVARGALAQWKGQLGEIVVGLFASQLNGIKGVEVTGGNIDALGKFIKSDVSSYTDTLDIGFSVKNYKTRISKKGNAYLPRSIELHSGGSFENFLNRLKMLQAGELQPEIDDIINRIDTDNYYYNLINEAAKKASFSSSDPAQDFIDLIKGMAAAWFGTQLVINERDGKAGQNVDFFVISGYGIIPMSVLLRGLEKQTAKIKVGIKSTASIDEEGLYLKKIKQPYDPKQGWYNQQVKNIGYYAGQEIYDGIDVSAIKLSLILSKLKI